MNSIFIDQTKYFIVNEVSYFIRHELPNEVRRWQTKRD